jgi:hypothetical protein
MCSFRDDASLGRESEAVTEGSRSGGGSGAYERVSEATSSGVSLFEAPPLDEHGGLKSPLLDPADLAHAEAAESGGISSGSALPSIEPDATTLKEVGAAEAAAVGDAATGPGKHAAHPMAGRVPCIVFSAGLIMALASGMTIKYFPLYFKNTLGFSPAAVQAIYVAVPLAMALASNLGTVLSKRMGRVQAVIAIKWAGLSCFSAMVVLDQHKYRGTPWGPWAIVVAYVLRTALMNCTYPVEESILMDYATKATRARWKSLESVSIAGWCGSAFLGGMLADAYGYTFTFVITIAVQFSATLVYASLLGVVVGEAGEAGETPAASDAPDNQTSAP